MVVFDELRITEDGGALIINAHLRKEIVEQDYANCISEIWVCDSSGYKEGAPSDANPIGAKVYSYAPSTGERHKVDIIVQPTDSQDLPTNFKGRLLFVYAVVHTIDEPVLPCSCARNPTIGVTMDMGTVYKQFMSYIDELCNTDSCSRANTKGLTDFILRFNSLLLAMDSRHYTKGIEFFDKWFSKDSKTVPSECGCHG